MGRVESYRGYVRELLTCRAQRYAACMNMEVQMLIDTERDHYQVLMLGWEALYRVYESLLHMDIRDGKIWIQEDRTEYGVCGRGVEV